MPILEFENREIHYETHGSGPPLLFLHEWNSSSDLFKFHALDRYADHHEVILIDLPGFGRSQTLNLLSMERLSQLLVRLLDHLGKPRASILGFCLGAILALDFTLRNPEKVEKLVLIDILVRFPTLLRVLFVPGLGPGLLAFFSRTSVGTALASRFLVDHKGFSQRLSRRFRQVRFAVSYTYLRMMKRYGTTDHLARAEGLATPVLCLATSGSYLPFRRCAQSLSTRLPRGHLALLSGGRHYTFLASPDKVSFSALAFINQAEPSVPPNRY